ncbi:5-methylcytosine-specific restriction endonuclease McrA [Bradyrhizobium sp. GM0.4]
MVVETASLRGVQRIMLIQRCPAIAAYWLTGYPTLPKPLDVRQRNREHDARRRTEQPWRAWYKTAKWRALREEQLSKQRLCERCLKRGVVRSATVVHHTIAHKGDAAIFWDHTKYASSCAPCHNSDEQSIERGGRARQAVGGDGWPIDDDAHQK